MREKAAVGEEMAGLRASHAREVALLQDQLHTVRESVAVAKQQAELARQALQVAQRQADEKAAQEAESAALRLQEQVLTVFFLWYVLDGILLCDMICDGIVRDNCHVCVRDGHGHGDSHVYVVVTVIFM
jgi:hypothetical protein